MTKTLSGYDQDPFLEDPLPCSLTLTAVSGSQTYPCPNDAVYDCFVNCDNDHDRTQHYCMRCHSAAVSGNVDCRECKNSGWETGTCPVTIQATYRRNNGATAS